MAQAANVGEKVPIQVSISTKMSPTGLGSSFFPNSRQMRRQNSENGVLMETDGERVNGGMLKKDMEGMAYHSLIVIKQWKVVTCVLDRLCAAAFLITNIVAFVLLFPRPSERYKQGL